ncbi:MAG: hypothetical protein J3R72DRAFT_426237 [Linnemannia gamsii]|nr:MAG: hypothetical protein J3R72DRAFT_426237 [Linnemannia gamsii]
MDKQPRQGGVKRKAGRVEPPPIPQRIRLTLGGATTPFTSSSSHSSVARPATTTTNKRIQDNTNVLFRKMMGGRAPAVKAAIRTWVASYKSPKTAIAATSKLVDLVLLSCGVAPLLGWNPREQDETVAEYIESAVTAALAVAFEAPLPDMEQYKECHLKLFWLTFGQVCHDEKALDSPPDAYSQPDPSHMDILDIIFHSIHTVIPTWKGIPRSCTLAIYTLLQIHLAVTNHAHRLGQEREKEEEEEEEDEEEAGDEDEDEKDGEGEGGGEDEDGDEDEDEEEEEKEKKEKGKKTKRKETKKSKGGKAVPRIMPPRATKSKAKKGMFTDPDDGHLAADATAPTRARLEDLVNPNAISYIIPRAISAGAFSDAVRSTHSALFKTHEDTTPLPILSNVTYPCADGTNHRIEIVYHESLDATIVSTTPILLDGKQYVPLSSTVSHIITRFIFMDYQFLSSLDFGVRLEQFCSWYFEDFKKMGKVIKIEIPLFPTPNGNYEARSQFAVYVKSDKTAVDSSSLSSDSTHSPSSSPHIPDDSAQHASTVQPALTTSSVTPSSQVVDLMGEEFPSNSSKDDITMMKDQVQGQVSQEIDFEDDISLTEADLEDLDRV